MRGVCARQRGLTLIELMVALSLGLLITLAAVAALTVARRGFTTVDAASQLRDNGRFATDLIQRVVQQTGFRDLTYAVATRSSEVRTAGAGANPEPDVKGYNNALVTSATSPLTLAHDSRDAAAGGCSAGDTACVNGSDVLVLRYQSAEGIAGSGLSDGAMINCAGQSELTAPAGSQARMVSILHVAKTASGEPALMCTAQSGGGWTTVPMVQGVESFQVLYGVDNVNPGAAPAGTTDSVPNRYLRADQLDVAANPVATNGNWRRVRTVRIGMVLRGPRNSAQDRGQAHRAYYPLGESLRSDADPGTTFTPSADGRLRHVLFFTLNLRNDQSLQ